MMTGPRRTARWRRPLGALAALWTLAAAAGEPPPEPEYLAPNIYTPTNVVTAMLQLAEVGPGDTVIDLGCGDGRIVVEAARVFGARGIGVDLDQKELAKSRRRAEEAGVSGRVEFRQEDLRTTGLADATVVTLYLGRAPNAALVPILEKQLKPGTRVVSHQFDMPGWFPEKTLTLRDPLGFERTVYLWVMGRQRIPPRKP